MMVLRIKTYFQIGSLISQLPDCSSDSEDQFGVLVPGSVSQSERVRGRIDGGHLKYYKCPVLVCLLRTQRYLLLNIFKIYF